MNLRKTINLALGLTLLVAGNPARAEEQHSITTALSSTTLSGNVDTSASWWIGTQNLGIALPGRTVDSSSIGDLGALFRSYFSQLDGLDVNSASSSAAAGPANDLIANATGVSVGSASVPTNLTTATLEASEPAALQQTGSVWYKWSVGQSGVVRISTNAITPLPAPAVASYESAVSLESIFYPGGGITTGGQYEYDGYEEWAVRPRDPFGYERWWTQLAVYRMTQLSEVQARLDFVARGGSLQFEVRAGESYWIAVEVYERSPSFEGQLEMPSALPTNLYFDLTPPPANDAFASDFAIANSAGGMMAGYALAATRETGEPDLGGEFSGGSVWFHYTAATYGTVAISDVAQNLPLAIFTGSGLSDLKLVAKSSAGGVSFFGEEGKVYHVAVYQGANTAGFNLSFVAPKYRFYETTVDALFPSGTVPHFYGVRGVTMLMYAKSAAGWSLVEVEPIVGQATDLLIRPSEAVEGQVRVITIDETLPSPRVELRNAPGALVADVVGIPGQTCAISYSSDLANWSQPQVVTLKVSVEPWGTFLPDTNYFFRVTQSLPVVTTGQILIGVQTQTASSGDLGGAVYTQIGSGSQYHGGVPTPPVPGF